MRAWVWRGAGVFCLEDVSLHNPETRCPSKDLARLGLGQPASDIQCSHKHQESYQQNSESSAVDEDGSASHGYTNGQSAHQPEHTSMETATAATRRSMERMDCSAVLQWLSARVCLDEDGTQVAQVAFTAHKITGAELLQATMGSLKRAYGISSWGVRLKIMLALDELSGSVKPAPAPAACAGATHGGSATHHYTLQECNLELLPDDTLVQICSYLAPRDMGMLQCVSLRFASREDRPLHMSVVESAAVCQLRAHPWYGNIWAAAAALHKAEQASGGLTCMDCGARSDFAADSLVSNFTHDRVCRCRQCELSYSPEAFSSAEAIQKWIQIRQYQPILLSDCPYKLTGGAMVELEEPVAALRSIYGIWNRDEAERLLAAANHDLQLCAYTNCPMLLLATLCASPAREIGDGAQLTLSTDALTSRNFLSCGTLISGLDRCQLATSYDSTYDLEVENDYPAHIRVHDDGMVAGVHFVEFVLPEDFRGQLGVVGSGASITGGDRGDSVWTRYENSVDFSRMPFWWKRPVNNPVCVDCGVRQSEGVRVESDSGIPRCCYCRAAYYDFNYLWDLCETDYRVCVDCGARESEGVRVESDSGIPRCGHCRAAYDCDYRVCVDCGARESEGVRVESDSGIPRCGHCRAAYDCDYRVCVDCGARQSEGVRVESDSGIPRCCHCRAAYELPLSAARPPIENSEEGGWETSTSSTGVLYDHRPHEVHPETVGLLLDIERQTLSVYLDGTLTIVFAGHGGNLRDKSLHWAVRSEGEHRPVAVERKPAPCTVPGDVTEVRTRLCCMNDFDALTACNAQRARASAACSDPK
eukprot:COSAG02_NODE_524_length_20723_cov_79.399438_13_plen_816_part_00